MYIYGASPIQELKKRNAKPRNIIVDTILDYGMNKINEEKFEVLSLKGHSIEHIGIATPDRVCFLGDGLFSDENMSKYPFPFLYDIEDQLETIEYIKTLEYDYYVLSHGSRVYNISEIRGLAERNLQNIERFIEDIKVLLNQPLTREELLEQIAVLNNISMDFRNYHLCLSSVGAFISYLYNKDILSYNIENGRLHYFTR
jgi:glyoxylase-like metal-dependent hydrolase (beta-lactamase superfamily II)